MHEVLTIQLGQQANYLGTHYWNTQESYFTYSGQDESPVDHNRSFRQGIAPDGSDTFTPRTLIYDLKGAFGTLRRENELYEIRHQPDPITQNAWGGSAMPLRLTPITQSFYQQSLTDGLVLPALTPASVRYWSDYNHVFYHPKSIVQLNEYELNSSIMPFEKFDAGEELFQNLDREHDVLDRDLRPFLEECDQLQFIQILGSTTDAWGGFAARYTERIADELGKGCRWMFSLDDNTAVPRSVAFRRLTNTIKSTDRIVSNVSMFIPLATHHQYPSYIDMSGKSPWTTSALQNVVFESMTLPSRLNQGAEGNATIDEIEQQVNTDGHRPIAAVSLSIFQDEESGKAQDARMVNGLSHDTVENVEMPLDIDFLPISTQSKRNNRLYASYELYRDNSGLARNNDGEDGIRRLSCQTNLLYPMLSSFPPIIKPNLEQYKVKTALNASERVAWYIKQMASSARSLLELDQREAAYDGLSNLAEEYEESMGFSDDDDDDD